MVKILFVMNILVTIIALVFWINGIKHLKNDNYNVKGVKHILDGISVTGICIILGAILLVPVLFPM
ncbi:hypothetical protein [Clostridium sp.]|uniref:hypothetical protein n=1 Tax=Clostridium sp. TaxID=1506 RepID=UPI001A37466F|nr:hypothetical protein [Clostridium sp.]MBK5242673.1 hypothetical protein [Clostridium sp.]